MDGKRRSCCRRKSTSLSQRLGLAGNAYQVHHAVPERVRQSITSPYFASLYYLYKNPNPVLAVRTIPLREIQTVSEGIEKAPRRPLQVLLRSLERVGHAREALEIWPPELVEHFRGEIERTLLPEILRGASPPTGWRGSEKLTPPLNGGKEGMSPPGGKGPPTPTVTDMLEKNPLLQPLAPLPEGRKVAILPKRVLHRPPADGIPAKKISARLLEQIGTHLPLQRRDPAQAREDAFFLLRRLIRHTYTPIGCAQIGPMNMVRVNYYYPGQVVDAILGEGASYGEILASTISEKVMTELLEVSEPELWWVIARLRRLSPTAYERLLVFHDGIFVGFRYHPRSIRQLRKQFQHELRQIYTLDGARQAAGFRSAPAFQRALQALLRHGHSDLGDHILPYSPTVVIVGAEVVKLLRSMRPLVDRVKLPSADLVYQAYQEVKAQRGLLQIHWGALRGGD